MKKTGLMRVRALALALVFLAGAFPVFGFTGHGGGDGSAATPWLISNATQLNAFRTASATNNFAGQHIRLTANIDLGGAPNQWTPIGAFSGTFDGGGHIVKGIFISGWADHQGFFRSLNTTGIIRNLGVDVNITGGSYVGGLVGGHWNNSGIIENSFVSGTVTGTGMYIGGITGEQGGGFAVIRNSFSTATVTGGASVGGLAGNCSGVIENSYATGVVTGSGAAVGALVGNKSGDVVAVTP